MSQKELVLLLPPPLVVRAVKRHQPATWRQQPVADSMEPCPPCRQLTFRIGIPVCSFWIACDECSRWFDGMCVGMTAQAAEAQRHWRCPLCERSKASG